MPGKGRNTAVPEPVRFHHYIRSGFLLYRLPTGIANGMSALAMLKPDGKQLTHQHGSMKKRICFCSTRNIAEFPLDTAVPQ
jgi:hypothetical protein